jgi:DNA-binding NarL/FixJ family response regulator
MGTQGEDEGEGVLAHPRTRVLVCENDPVMRAALCDLIESVPGLELVGWADDADSAAERARQTLPDAAVIDVRMPGGGGPRAAHLIGLQVPTARLIAYSAHAERESVLGMIRAGAQEYLIKGLDDADLVDALRRTGRGRITLPLPQLQELLLDLAQLLTETEARLEAAQLLLGAQSPSDPVAAP